MTHAIPLTAAQPSTYLPSHQTLDQWMGEVTHLWDYATGTDTRVEECTQVFGDFPGAQSDSAQARELSIALRRVLELSTEVQPAPRPSLPFANIPLAAPQPAAQTESRDEEGTEDSGGGNETVGDDAQEGHNDEAQTEGNQDSEAPDETPEDGPPAEETDGPELLAVSSEGPQWPEGLLGEGLISQLAATLKPTEMVQFVIARVKNTLVISIVPSKIGGEAAGTCLTLQVTGTPEQLDTELPGAMFGYQEARQTARQSADALLAEVKAGAEKAKQDAAKSKSKSPATPAKPTAPAIAQDGKSVVTLAVQLAGATPDQKYAYDFISDTKANNHKGTSQQGSSPVRMLPGKYILQVTSDKYAMSSKTVTVEQGVAQTVDINLALVGGPGLF